MAEAAAEKDVEEEAVDLNKIHEELHAEEEESADAENDDVSDDLTEDEEEALAEGWQPDGKDKDGNTLSAKEYLSRRPLFRRIKNLNEKIEGLTNTVQSLQAHNKVTSEKAIADREKLIEELTAAKKAAFKDMDIEEAERIDKELESIPEVPAPTDEPKYTQDQWDDYHKTFVDENTWYKENAGLSAAANDFGREYMQAHPGCSPEQLYTDVIKRIKESFPDNFQKRRASAVSSNATRTKPKSSSKKHTFNDIPPEHQSMARVVINSGVSEEEYLKQYFMGN